MKAQKWRREIMNAAKINNIKSQLLPGFGFFGVGDHFSLRCPVGHEVDSITFTIDKEEPEFLNLSSVKILDARGRPIERGNGVASISIDPTYNGETADKQFDLFSTGKMLHSGRAVRPKLTIQLASPLVVSKIVIENRIGIFSRRSKHLTVSAQLRGTRVFHYDNASEDRFFKEVSELFSKIGLASGDVKSISQRALYARILNKIEDQELDWSVVRLAQFLPVFSPKQCMTDFHINICAHMVKIMLGDNKSIPTESLRSLSHLLSNDLRLKRLSSSLTEISGSSQSLVISKHLIHGARLRADRDKYVKALVHIIALLEELNVQPMISYGTLLGLVRDGDFLEHDDDVDILYFDGSSTKEEALENRHKLVNRLEDRGVKSGTKPNWNFHPNVAGVSVDLFPSWLDENGNFHLMMEKGQIRPIPRAIVLPRKKGIFFGHELPIPADPEGFLTERYHKSWAVADPYHEWRWPLDRALQPTAERRKGDRFRRETTRKHLGRLCIVAWGQRVGRTGAQPPKNSLPLIERAVRRGYDAIEVDVRIANDGTPVLSHDERLHGPDGSIAISQASSNELQKFRLGTYDGQDVFVATLAEALHLAGDKDVQIDARIGPRNYKWIRKCVDQVGFDRARLQFCVYGLDHAETLVSLFPESVLLWKTYDGFDRINNELLDEVSLFGLDGVMVSMPLPQQDYGGFVAELKKRNLRVLFFILGGQARPFPEGPDSELRRMQDMGVDYVTTFIDDVPMFDELVSAGRL